MYILSKVQLRIIIIIILPVSSNLKLCIKKLCTLSKFDLMISHNCTHSLLLTDFDMSMTMSTWLVFERKVGVSTRMQLYTTDIISKNNNNNKHHNYTCTCTIQSEITAVTLNFCITKIICRFKFRGQMVNTKISHPQIMHVLILLSLVKNMDTTESICCIRCYHVQ